MELARQERLLAKPKNWGAITYQNIHKREQEITMGITTKKILSLGSNVRKALENHATIHGPLDATDVLTSLTEDEQCSFFSEYPELEILIMRSWFSISQNVLRSISISFSDRLVEIDLSKSAVQSSHMELLFVRAANLQSLKLNECYFVDVQCSIVIVNLLFRTLRELYLHKCPQINNECLLWFGGGTALASQPLYKLRALDLSWNESIDDKGILAIAASCRKLAFLNLENCPMISDKGLVPLIQACKNMQLANLSGLFKISNKSAISIGKSWPELLSLNISRCPLISDKGIKQIALGCKNLQAINLAGLLKLSEEAMFCLADQCKALMTLNLTGCERITMNGLDHLVRGLDYVEKGITFMGFKPIDQHVEKKLDDNLKMIKTTVTKRMEEEARRKKELEEHQKEEFEKKINHATSVIQAYMYRYMRRMYFYGLWRLRLKKAGAATVQRVYRGYKGRIRAEMRRIEVIEFLSNTPYAIIIQRNVRGHLCRIKMKKVSKAIREMYLLRKKEVEAALMVKIQAQARCFLAKKRVQAWREICSRRKLNVHHAVTIIQQFGRFVLAKVRTQKRRIEKKNRDEARRIASIKIYAFCVEGIIRYKSKLSGEELRRYYRHKWTAAVTIQRYYRGYKGREKYQKRKIGLAAEYFAAREIQRIFRGTRVLHWKDMRLNVIAAFVLDRHYVERQRSIVASRNRYKAFIIENQKDSASEPDEEDDGGENPWLEGYDKKKNMRYWHNFITNEVTFDEPLIPLAHEKGMIGKRVKIYWVVQAQWYEGSITRYHKRKGRHRVEYDDGDHEWINLENDCDRIQVQMPDGSWTMYVLYQSEAKMDEMRKLEEKRQRENFKEQAYRDAMQWKSFIDDHDKKTIMFLSTLTGEIRTGIPTALDWVVQDDGYGFPCFYNMVSQNIVYEDPRFTYDVDEDLLQQRKYVMQELRLCVYLCKDLWEEYSHGLTMYEGLEHREMHKILLKIRNSPKPTQLNSFLIRAKALYQPTSIVDKPMDKAISDELEYAAWLSTRLAEVLDHAEEFVRKRKEDKNKVVAKLTENSGKVVFCSNCKRETKRHLEYCPHCGKQQIFV